MAVRLSTLNFRITRYDISFLVPRRWFSAGKQGARGVPLQCIYPTALRTPSYNKEEHLGTEQLLLP